MSSCKIIARDREWLHLMAKLSSVTEILLKSSFFCVNRGPIQYCFLCRARAIPYSVNTEYVADPSCFYLCFSIRLRTEKKGQFLVDYVYSAFFPCLWQLRRHTKNSWGLYNWESRHCAYFSPCHVSVQREFRDMGCWPLTESFRKNRLESEWNKTFWVVSKKTFQGQRNIWKVIMFFQTECSKRNWIRVLFL